MIGLKECLEKRFLVKSKSDEELSNKELNEAEYDLEKAEKALKDKDHKWCIVKCYYSMFHAAKAILCKEGYMEKKHIAIVVVLEELNKEGKIENKFVNDFKAAMSAREDADYHYSYSQETAEYDLEICKEFLNMTKGFLEKN